MKKASTLMGFDVGHLVVELSRDAKAELGDGITVEALAQQVLDFLRSQIA